jgi:lysophospholipase L1-like esterase
MSAPQTAPLTEADDPRVLPDEELRVRLAGAPWRRLVAVGDSIAAGIREPVDGYRDLGWVDRIAAALRAETPALEHANLGVRDRRAAVVRAEQLDAALAFRPDLAIVAAGGNDLLGRRWKPAAVEHELDAIVGPLRAAGADVLTLDLVDASGSPYIPDQWRAAFAERLHALADVTRAVSARHGGLHLELRGDPLSADPAIYASDGLHLNARGHAIVATAALRRLAAALPHRPNHEQEHDHA